MRGTAAITLRATAAGATSSVAEAWLDTSALDVSSASAVAKGEAAASSSSSSSSFTLDAPHPVLGTRLRVPLTQPLTKEGEEVTVTVAFSTTALGTALQWLPAEATASKKFGFLFSQCQAIHARSFLPCQDTPGAKVTYDARVAVPAGMIPRMSALDVGEPEDAKSGVDGEDGNKKKRFSFEQPVPLSPYLLALAVGELERRDMSPRCAVWAEPSVVEAAAREFSETEEFLAAVEAESLRAFRWRRADLLVLPKSFPYGGMESIPTIFVTPTLIVGDRSQAGVVAHELCHSVFGNDVSCATWGDFWLNEGFTVWLERRVVARVRGRGAAALSAASGLAALKEAVRSFGEEHPFTRLVPLLPEGADPDDAFSKIPYEKGYCFIKYLEGLVDGNGGDGKKTKNEGEEKGGDDDESSSSGEFAKWVAQSYVAPRVGATATSDDFKREFLAAFGDREAVVAAKVDWDAWLHSPGMPPVDEALIAAPSALGDAAEALAKKWSEAADDEQIRGPPAGASAADIAGWPAQQVTFFLETLAEARAAAGRPLPAAAAAALGELYGFDVGKKDAAASDDTAAPAGVGGCEVLCEYLCLALAAGHAPAVPAAAALLQKVGRMKYCRPLFRALAAADDAAAKGAFAMARAGLHPICAKMVASDLGVAEA